MVLLHAVRSTITATAELLVIGLNVAFSGEDKIFRIK